MPSRASATHHALSAAKQLRTTGHEAYEAGQRTRRAQPRRAAGAGRVTRAGGREPGRDPLRVDLVDPPAYTPPYDHALAAALGRAGAAVRLVTSPFGYGSVPRPDGYVLQERFYRRAAATGGPGAGSRPSAPSTCRTWSLPAGGPRRRRRPRPVADRPQLDAPLLPRGRPLVLTAHDVLPREPRPGQGGAQRRLLRRFDAVVVPLRPRTRPALGRGRRRPRARPRHPARRVHHLTRRRREPLPAVRAAAVERPVVLLFGLVRPYKGLDVLLEAWRAIDGAELWIVGLPRMDSRRRGRRAPGVRFVERFVGDAELGVFRRADLVVLPYREIDQSGVLFTALAFGKPLLLTRRRRLPRGRRDGRGRARAPGDPAALARALAALLGDPAARGAPGRRGPRRPPPAPTAGTPIARRRCALRRALLA